MLFIDLFCGIGGFRYGLEASTKKQHKFTCVFSNEWDKYASSIYKKHFGECDTRDIRTIDVNEIPNHDLLCAGFPCQAFSISGKRRGFEDTRRTLFFEIARIARAKRPKLLFLENVKGLLSHDNGRTFGTILSTLSSLGYVCEWQILNSKNFGVPQNRERVFIIGHFGGIGRQTVFPLRRNSESNFKYSTKMIFNRDNIYYSDKKIIQYLKTKENGLYTIGMERGVSKKRNKAGTLLTRHPLSIANQEQNYVIENRGIRCLTPIECARLQGFPDDWCKGLSDRQAYCCYGNAVTTNVIQAIGERILEISER